MLFGHLEVGECFKGHNGYCRKTEVQSTYDKIRDRQLFHNVQRFTCDGVFLGTSYLPNRTNVIKVEPVWEPALVIIEGEMIEVSVMTFREF